MHSFIWQVRELREYQIPFIGLKNEVNHFNYEIDKKFFSHFDDSLVQDCRIFVDLSLDKKDRLFILNFDISGTMRSECDRCGEDFDLALHGNHTIYVKLGDLREEDENNEEVVWIPDSEAFIDVKEMIYEFVHLSIPIKKTHPDRPDGTTECDPEILKYIITPDTGQEAEIQPDPRWDILNKLNKN
ncbi:MAG: DUF177 domain-containing protein [Chitinophagales bacterium]|nr:DUF177 domain-containing protein [Chitinophagales bacterium]